MAVSRATGASAAARHAESGDALAGAAVQKRRQAAVVTLFGFLKLKNQFTARVAQEMGGTGVWNAAMSRKSGGRMARAHLGLLAEHQVLSACSRDGQRGRATSLAVPPSQPSRLAQTA